MRPACADIHAAWPLERWIGLPHVGFEFASLADEVSRIRFFTLVKFYIKRLGVGRWIVRSRVWTIGCWTDG